MNKIRIAGVVKESIVDGPGLRYVIFTQGCNHKCEGCHNPQTHDFNGGYEESIENFLNDINENPLLKGVTLSGGEPFEQAVVICVLCDMLKEKNLDIVTYTGYTFEELLKGANKKNQWFSLLERTDILIDGRFVLSKRSLALPFRGSSNQRIIECKESLKNKKVAEMKI